MTSGVGLAALRTRAAAGEKFVDAGERTLENWRSFVLRHKGIPGLLKCLQRRFAPPELSKATRF